MKRSLYLVILVAAIFTCCTKPAPNYTMEGKWTYPGNSQNCIGSDCDSLYNTFQAGDTNSLPSQLNYTFINDTLRVDLNFGNELVTPITFECDGGKANFTTPGYSLVRLNSGCN